jgi:hypothetical protein
VSGSNPFQDNGIVTYPIDEDKFPMSLAQTVVALGGTVTEMPFFIKIDNVNSNVPQGIPNRTFEDEPEHIKTWTEWKKDNYDFHVLSDGFTYIAAEANTGDFVVLNDFMSEAANLIDVETFKSLLPTE